MSRARVTNMVCEAVGDIIISLHSSQPPSDEEWDKHMTMVRGVAESAGVESMRTIVVTDGGGPSFAQRLRLNDVLKGRPVFTSVVSQSVLVRGIVSALRVFNPRIRWFPPESTEEAFQHVRLTRAETRVVERVIQRLRRELQEPT